VQLRLLNGEVDEGVDSVSHCLLFIVLGINDSRGRQLVDAAHTACLGKRMKCVCVAGLDVDALIHESDHASHRLLGLACLSFDQLYVVLERPMLDSRLTVNSTDSFL